MSSRSVDIIQTAGVNDVYNYIEIHLDTQFADNKPDVTLSTARPIPPIHPEWTLSPPVSDVLGVKLLTAQIPYTADVVNSTNNTFSTDVGQYDIPVGNYNVTELLAALNALTIDPGQANAPYLEWSYVSRTGSLAARSLDGTDHSLVLGEASPVGLFGLGGPETLTITPDGTSIPGILNVSGPNYFLLTSRAIASRIHANVRVNGTHSPNPLILAKIPNTVNPGGVLLYTDPSPGYAFDMNLDQLTTIDLQLLRGDTLQPVEFKAPWSVTLAVLTQRDTTIARNRDVPQKSGNNAKRIRVR